MRASGYSAWTRSTILSVISFFCVQTGDDLRLLDAGGTQHVEPVAVAEIDAEAEGRRLANARGGMVDDRHVATAGKQDLRGDLAETRKADHQHVGAGTLEVLLHFLGHLVLFTHEARGEHGGDRRQRHRKRNDGDEQRCGCPARRRRPTAAAVNSTKPNSPPCGREQADAHRVVVVRAGQPGRASRGSELFTSISTGTATMIISVVLDHHVKFAATGRPP